MPLINSQLFENSGLISAAISEWRAISRWSTALAICGSKRACDIRGSWISAAIINRWFGLTRGIKDIAGECAMTYRCFVRCKIRTHAHIQPLVTYVYLHAGRSTCATAGADRDRSISRERHTRNWRSVCPETSRKDMQKKRYMKVEEN